jgi:hypothetical protein
LGQSVVHNEANVRFVHAFAESCIIGEMKSSSMVLTFCLPTTGCAKDLQLALGPMSLDVLTHRIGQIRVVRLRCGPKRLGNSVAFNPVKKKKFKNRKLLRFFVFIFFIISDSYWKKTKKPILLLILVSYRLVAD